VPYGVAVDQYHAGTLAGDETFAFPLPAEAAPASATLDVRVDPALGGVLADSLAALLDEGAGQGTPATVADRLAVGSVLSRLVRQGQVPADSLPENLSPATALDLQYLYQAQNADGSWGVWPGSAGDARTTAAVLEALWWLADEQAAGGSPDVPAVDRGTRDRGVAWLRVAAAPPAQPPGAPPAPAGDTTAARRAQALYVLSLYNSASRDEIRPLIAVSGQLSPAGRGWLALALDRIGSHEEARTLLSEPVPTGTPTRAETAPGATALDLALGLRARLAVDPDGAGGPDAPRLAAALLAARQDTAWAGPGATGAAVQALAAWAPRAPAAVGSSSGKYRLLDNGQVIKEVVMGPRGSGGTLRLQVPGSALRTGDNAVRLVAEGETTLYYSLHLAALVGTPPRPLAGDHAPAFSASLLRDSTPPASTSWRAGTPVHITLTLTLDQAVPGFQITEPLPGAFGGVRDLRVTSLPPAPADTAAPVVLGTATGPGGVVVRLGPLPAGTYQLSYTARLDQAGVFGALPAGGVVPDAPGLWVRSGGRTVTIER
jgi:hypothetical protein